MVDIECDDILSQYDNPELIHCGGQRVVYTVNHCKFGKAILKIGKHRTIDNQDGWELERIERETETLKQIDSEYYPKNLSFEKVSGNRFVIIEEFIESTPLTKCMDRFQNQDEAIDLIKKLVTGLEIIWSMNIVHRDLKPDNILITPDGLPKIIDLGIARALDNESITRTFDSGPLSLSYAAPEQLHYNKKLIDFRTDQYNLGIILMQLLLKGTHPFDPRLVGGHSIPENIMLNNWYTQAFDNGNLSKARPLVLKLLGYYPYQRFRTSEMLMREIESCSRC